MGITRTAIVDDSGGGGDGTVINNAWKQEFYDQIDAVAGATVQTTTVTGTQNDFALTTGAAVLRVNNASLVTFNGFSAGYDGQRLTLISIGAGEVDFAHQNAGSTAANRLVNFVTSGITPLAAGVGTATYVYDGTTARWRLVAHEQGDWILRTFAAGNYTGNGSMTWTVDSGDVANDSFYLKGRHLSFDFDLSSTTVGGTLNTSLQIALPNGWTSPSTGSVKVQRAAVTRNIDNAGTPVGGYAFVDTPNVRCNLMNNPNWSAATNATAVQGQIMVILN